MTQAMSTVSNLHWCSLKMLWVITELLSDMFPVWGAKICT